MSSTDAYDETECLLCGPASHPNCEKYTVVEMLDRENIPLGEDAIDHTVEIPVCLEHHEVLRKYRQGQTVAEVSR